MPPVLAMPLVAKNTGYDVFYTDQSLEILNRVRTRRSADTSLLDGLNIRLRNVNAGNPYRNIFAMGKGQVLFGYQEMNADHTPIDATRVRAILMLESEVYAGAPPPPPRNRRDPNRQRFELKLVCPETSWGNIHQNFINLKFIEYRNLDLTRTRELISQLIQQASARHDERILDTPVQRRFPVAGSSGRIRPTMIQTIRGLFDRNVPLDAYLDEVLFNPVRLRTFSDHFPQVVEGHADQPAELGLRLNVGDIIGSMASPVAAAGGGDSDGQLFIKFWHEAFLVKNPCFFFNALAKNPDAWTTIDDPSGKWGIPSILDNPTTVTSLRDRIHPLWWAFTSAPEHGIFRNDSGNVLPAPYPSLFVAPASAEAEGIIHLMPNTHLDSYHTFKRVVVEERSGPPTGEVLQGAGYQWQIDSNGYIRYRTNGDIPGSDDWNAVFSKSDYDKVTRIWQRQGDTLRQFCEPFRIPIETFVGIAAKEGGPSGDRAIGLEPWIPPPPSDLEGYTTSEALSTMPPADVIQNLDRIPGLRYLLLTTAWDHQTRRWGGFRGTRHSALYNFNTPSPLRMRTGIAVRIRTASGRDEVRFVESPDPTLTPEVQNFTGTYSWEQLFNDMDHFGSHYRPSSAYRPRVMPRQEHIFMPTLDRRISPGPTQNLISNIPNRDRILRAIDPTQLERLTSTGFFNQRHDIPDTRDRPRPVLNILDESTPPSYRFLWLLDIGHNAFVTLVNWRNLMHQLSENTLSGKYGERNFLYRMDSTVNHALDPVLIVTLHGGFGDIARYDPGTVFGIDDDSPPQWHTFPRNFNACVHLFEHASLASVPSTRY
jgi:hypothetical protein